MNGPTMDGDEDVDEQALSRLADSFHSEGGGRSRRKVVSWSQERRGESLGRHATISPTARVHPTLRMTTSPVIGGTEDFDFSSRGRSASRARGEEGQQHHEEEWTPTSAERRSSRASRKGAGMVFWGVWALFGIGTLAGSRRGLPSQAGLRIGRVLGGGGDVAIPPTTIPIAFTATAEVHPSTITGRVVGDVGVSWAAVRSESEQQHPDEPAHGGEELEYTIGRISAWVCTTLYLTSRLPQIWKNVRRSFYLTQKIL